MWALATSLLLENVTVTCVMSALKQTYGACPLRTGFPALRRYVRSCSGASLLSLANVFAPLFFELADHHGYVVVSSDALLN